MGQGTVEWVAVLTVCAVLAMAGARGLATVANSWQGIDQALATVAQPATPPSVPVFPSLRASPLPSGDGASAIRIAERLLALGIVEQPPGSNSGAAILTFTDGNAEAWCADFVSWVLREAGQPFSGGASGGWRLAWTPDVRAWFELRGQYRARLVATPEPGDIVSFQHGHIGFVRRATPTRLETVEGNAGDAVAQRVYENWRSNSNIHGFGRPLAG